MSRELSNKDPRSELGYQLTVQTDPADAARPLAVFHRPSIGSKESSDMADRAVHESLSMERLLVHTVYIRSLARLADIKSEFLKFLKNDSDCTCNSYHIKPKLENIQNKPKIHSHHSRNARHSYRANSPTMSSRRSAARLR